MFGWLLNLGFAGGGNPVALIIYGGLHRIESGAVGQAGLHAIEQGIH